MLGFHSYVLQTRLLIFLVVWKERNRRTFEGMKENLDRGRVRWIKTLGFLLISQSLYSMEDLGKIIDMLVNM